MVFRVHLEVWMHARVASQVIINLELWITACYQRSRIALTTVWAMLHSDSISVCLALFDAFS